ncbi:MAG TPA: hypothetical protein VNU21_01045, partial [Usitatibacter sp.]|nr:hypothetical protein [Usitatibacter sp.]
MVLAQLAAYSVAPSCKKVEQVELIGFSFVAARISRKQRENISGAGAGLSIATVGTGGGRHTGRL